MEQQRLDDGAVLRRYAHLFQVNVGRHQGDGLSAPQLLRQGRPRGGLGALERCPATPTARASSIRSTSPATTGWLLLPTMSRPGRQVPAPEPRGVRLRVRRGRRASHASEEVHQLGPDGHRASSGHLRDENENPDKDVKEQGGIPLEMIHATSTSASVSTRSARRCRATRPTSSGPASRPPTRPRTTTSTPRSTRATTSTGRRRRRLRGGPAPQRDERGPPGRVRAREREGHRLLEQGVREGRHRLPLPLPAPPLQPPGRRVVRRRFPRHHRRADGAGGA